MKGNCSTLERYNGGTWQKVSKRISMSGPGLSRETVEEELSIDCDATGGNPYKQKSPGTKEIGDISVEILWNPVVPSGTHQIERAVAAGTVTASGNALVTITAAGMTGSPIALNVPVTNGQNAAGVALTIRNFIAGDASAANVRAFFEVGGTGTNIDLTCLEPAADDATLNIAIATGTATGITAAPNSTTVVAGVAGSDNDENHHLFEDDFENETATFWRITHPNTEETGVVVHATVKEVGEPEYAANQTVKRTVVIEPTGRFYKSGNSIVDVELPATITAPEDHYGHH